MMRAGAVALIAGLLAGGVALAQGLPAPPASDPEAQPLPQVQPLPGPGVMLDGAAIREAFTGNTVSGTYVNGKPFAEFHARDGRALGDNGFALNVDACWNVDGDKACYHYGPYKDRRTYCFTVEKRGATYLLKVAESGRLNAYATIEAGNPQSLGDGGRRWSCDDLLSRAPGIAPRVARRTIDPAQ